MAPEQFRDAQTVDHRADIYSYGSSSSKMITGHRPFQADTFLKLARQHEKAPVPSVVKYIPGRHARVAKAVDRIVQSCLAKDPLEARTGRTRSCAATSRSASGTWRASGWGSRRRSSLRPGS